MSEEISTTAAPVESRPSRDPFKLIDFTPDEVQFVYEMHGADAENVLARSTMAILNAMPEFRGTADYFDVQQGRAPIVRTLSPELQTGKGLTDDQILRTFSTLKSLGDEGLPTETDVFLRGLTKGGFSLAGGVAGAKLAASAAPPVLPIGPLGVLSKPVAGAAGFIGGSIFGDLVIGDPLANLTFSPDVSELNLTPRAEQRYRFLETTGMTAPFVVMPNLAPKAVLNMASNLKKLPLANQATQLTAEDYANPLITQFLAGKLSGIPTTKQFTQLRDKIFTEAEKAGNKISLKQAGKQAAKELNRPGKLVRGTIAGVDYAEKALVGGGKAFREMGLKGKGFVYGTEALAAPAAGLASEFAEENFPRQTGKRVTAEVAGSILPQITLLKLAPSIYTGLSGYVTRRRESLARGEGLDLFGTKSKAKDKAVQTILQVFEDNKNDPNELLKRLEEEMITPITDEQGRVVEYRLKPQFADIAATEKGDKLPIFASQFVDSPELMQLEQAVLARSGRRGSLDLSKDDNFQKSMELQRGLILNLRGTGDPNLVKIAGEMMQDNLSILISARLNRAIQNTIESVQQVYPDGGPEASREISKGIANAVKTQRDLFRKLEKSAWDKTSKTTEINSFYRLDDETGEYVETNIPNIIEEWDATLKDLDEIEIPGLLREAEFQDLNSRIIEIRQGLGLSGTTALSAPPPQVQAFNDLYASQMGLPNRKKYDQLISANDITDEATEENIRKLGNLESSLSRGQGEEKKLVNAKRLALIAELQAQQTAAATGVVSQPVTQGNLTAIYSKMRNLQRKLATVDDNYARIANNMAEAALEDLNQGGVGNPTYDAARDLSFAFNTFLKRTFGGDILATNARGRKVVDENLLRDKLFSGKPDAVALRLDEVRRIGEKLDEYAKKTGYEVVAEEAVDASRKSTDDVLLQGLRLAMRDIELPIEARSTLSPAQQALAQNNALQQFRVKHAQLFQVFPELGRMMDESQDAATFLQRSQKTIKLLQDKSKDYKAFQKLTGAENPERAIQVAFNSDKPIRELNSLIELISIASDPRKLRAYRQKNKTNLIVEDDALEKAKEGLKRSALQFAIGKGGDDFNVKLAYDRLFDRIPNAADDNNTLAQFLLDNKIISDKEFNSLKTGLVRLIQTETKKRVSDAVLAGNTGYLEDLYTRITGAKLGSAIGDVIPGGRGAGLVEAEAGSRYLRQLTQELPAIQEFDALEKILLDTELLGLALRTPRSESEKAGIFRAIGNKLLEFGIGTIPQAGKRAVPFGATEVGTEEIPSEPPVSEPAPEPQAAVQAPQQNLMAQRFARPTPTVIQPRQQPVAQAPAPAPRPPALAQGQANPAQRQRLAQLFPNDPLAQAAGPGGGIGSLFS